MAKYTETLAEYLDNGNSLPTSFSIITGFEDLFKHYYCDKEIGFETELLFFMKLDMTAELNMQRYKDKIDRLTAEWTLFANPTKTTSDTETNELDAGAQEGSTTELPMNSNISDPAVVNRTEAYRNVATRRLTRTEQGATEDEAMRRVEFVQKQVQDIKMQLLKEFNNCFMNVY